jgi:3-oxoacyl-[acyl-carrier protein] reductase
MTAQLNPLSGKIALVTGGSRGIGAGIARALAGQGANVILTYARGAQPAEQVVQSIRSDGGQATALATDVSRPDQITALIQRLRADHGRIDILVNNAGVYLTAPLAEFTDADYDTTMDVNVRAVFLVTRAALPLIPDGGRIINIGSVLGERSLGPNLSVYAASKFAVVGLTRGWARDLAPRNITVNCVQPGPIDTDMNPADTARNPGAAGMASMVPLGRYGRADEVAATVAFLASPQATYITGATLTVDGGMIA